MLKKSLSFFAIAILVFSFIFALLPIVHADNTNLAVIPDSFLADMNGAASSYASIDYSTTHNGAPSIRTGPDYVRGTREVDGAWLSVKPGDHIVLSCWIKTAPYTPLLPYSGAEIGWDYYVSSSQGYGIPDVDSAGDQAGHPNGTEIVNDYSSLTGGITCSVGSRLDVNNLGFLRSNHLLHLCYTWNLYGCLFL